MKAVVIKDFGGAEKMEMAEVDMPKPEAGEVQIKTCYAAVNPVDWKIRDGLVKGLFKFKFPIVLGWDVAGTVSAVGAGVTDLKVGDEVYAYCRKPTVQWGTFAEYVCFDAKDVAPKPKKLSMAEAASIPLAALTAWQGLFEFIGIKEGQCILIHAGAGGVGGMAIQFAKQAGATVITTASEGNHPYVMELGADIVIDYQKQDFVEELRKSFPNGLDAVFDCAGGTALKKSFAVVKKGGVLCTITTVLDESMGKKEGIKAGFFIVKPNGKQLTTIANLIDEGKMEPPEIHEYNLDQAPEALEKSKGGHTRGKIVLKVSS